MRAIRKEPGNEPEIIEIENTLEALQKEVGGYIQAIGIEDNCCVICDEEGRLKGYEQNCVVGGIDFVGPILIVGVAGEDFADLEDAEYVMEHLFGKTLMLTYDKETGMFKEYRQPWAVLEFATRADFEMHQDLVERGAAFEWIDPALELPTDPEVLVLVIVNGMAGGVGLIDAVQLATYDGEWILEMWPEANGFRVDYWMPLPPMPWKMAERLLERLKEKRA